MRGKAIWAAYAQTNALAVPCGHCSAPAGTWCSLPDGRVRRIPCVSRVADATAGRQDQLVNSLPPTAPARGGRDFTEPLYQPD
ncbi:zinc finger domain-containing protein [Mycobacterium scrofulaceum]|uniref:zinc finger domain-containing protein n=1 Tax=Mycobacterium scrofulaceum TaxID=1783 RepID=UPI003F6DC2C4